MNNDLVPNVDGGRQEQAATSPNANSNERTFKTTIECIVRECNANFGVGKSDHGTWAWLVQDRDTDTKPDSPAELFLEVVFGCHFHPDNGDIGTQAGLTVEQLFTRLDDGASVDELANLVLAGLEKNADADSGNPARSDGNQSRSAGE